MRLFNADCIKIMNELIAEEVRVDLILVDPPYQQIAESWDNIVPFDSMWCCCNKLIKKDGAILVFSAQPFTSVLINSNLKNFKYCWYWGKNQSTNFFHAKRMPLRKIEEICVFNSKIYYPQITDGHEPTRSAKGCSNGRAYYGDNKRDYEGGKTTRYPNNYLEFKCVDNYNRLHPSQKPVELLEYLIKTYTKENDTILDFCMGSGSTGVACKNLNRHFIGIELDKNYFDIAKNRIDNISIKESKKDLRKKLI